MSNWQTVGSAPLPEEASQDRLASGLHTDQGSHKANTRGMEPCRRAPGVRGRNLLTFPLLNTLLKSRIFFRNHTDAVLFVPFFFFIKLTVVD